LICVSLGRRRKCYETHLDDHRRTRRSRQLQMVPVALRPAPDAPGPRLFWSDPGYGWNRVALPPSVARARASHLEEPGRRNTWQGAPLVLPCRRLRDGAEEGTRSG